MTRLRVLVTPRSMTTGPSESLDRLRNAGFELVMGPAGRQPTPGELAEILPGIDAWIAGVEPIDDTVLSHGSRLRLISRNGAGRDSIDLVRAHSRGVAVLTAPGANAAGVAELTIALMLALLRHIPESSRGLAAGEWSRSLGLELSARTVGIVGLGAIGRRVHRLASAFGAQVIGHDPFALDTRLDHPPLAELDELLTRADVISLHAPAPVDGRPLIGSAQLRGIRPGAVLVNTSRWELVDDVALLEALQDSRLSGYAIDAFPTEPPAPHPLFDHPRVIATAHIGAFTGESVRRASEIAVDNVVGFFAKASHEA